MPIEDEEAGRHPRSVVHDLKKKLELAMLKQAEGNELSTEELTEIRSETFRLATNILFALRADIFDAPSTHIKTVIDRVVGGISVKLSEVQISVSCPLDAYAYIHPQLFDSVMLNLLHNSISAAMTANVRDVQVRVFTIDVSSGVTISVLNHYNPEQPKSETSTGIGLEEVKYFIRDLSGGEVKIFDDEKGGIYEVHLLLPATQVH